MKIPAIDSSGYKTPILVVEDDPSIRHLVADALDHLGLTCHLAGNGREALDRLATTRYDIVITDIQMPEMDGMELLRQIRPLYPAINVIAMTGYSTNYTATDVIQAGACDFMAKPFTIKEMRAKLDRVFRNRSPDQ